MKTITRKNGRTYSIRDDRHRFFFPAEWKKFYDALKKNQKPTFDILINTGARINEARNINYTSGDIDLANGRIVLRVTKIKAAMGEKTPRPRIIPISSEFGGRLKKYVKNGFRFLSTPAANIAMKKALERAGFADWREFSIHNIRKTLETWLLALDVDSLKVVKHLGHSMSVAAKHYVSPDSFTYQERKDIRDIIGDLYAR